MSAAASNRGSRSIRERVERESSPAFAGEIARLNSIPKGSRAGRPFGDVAFVEGNGGWWALDAIKGSRGRGFWFASLELAVVAFLVRVVCIGWIEGQFAFFAEPQEAEVRR